MTKITVTLTAQDAEALEIAFIEAYDSLYEASRACDHEHPDCEVSEGGNDGCRFAKMSDQVAGVHRKLMDAEEVA